MIRKDLGLTDTARQFWPVAAVFVFGLAGSGILTGILLNQARQSDQNRFDTLAHFMQERLDDRVEKYEQALALIRELFNHDTLIDQIQSRQMLERQSGHTILKTGSAKPEKTN